MSNLKCIACNTSKPNKTDVALEGEALEMFNFVCCLEISDQNCHICGDCNEELGIAFQFKKRCLEIFANVYDHTNPAEESDAELDDVIRWDSLLDQTLDEGENSLNLNDLLIPEVCFGSSALSVLDVSDNTKCRYCFTEFDTKDQCLVHQESHKGDDKPYKCPQDGCNSSFKARKNLKDHYLVHSNERPFSCHFCSQTFKSSSNRSKHERRIHSKERNAMRLANAQITKLVEKNKVDEAPPVYKRPEIFDSEDRTFRCEHEGCTSSFKTRSSLRDHQKVHSDNRPFKCNYCDSAFKSSSNRSKHERGSHSVEYLKRKREREGLTEEPLSTPKKPKISGAQSSVKRTEHPCRYCDRVFSRADRRDNHETTHKDIKAFDCGFCSNGFKTQELLKIHVQEKHTATKLSCSFEGCEEVFPDRRKLNQHEKEHETMHENSEEYVCNEANCGKTYSSPKALSNHRKMKHNDENIRCDICQLSFRKTDISQHLLIHI